MSRRAGPSAGRPAGPGPRAGVALVVGLLVAALGACASMPQSGPVQQGDPDVTEPGSIALLARLPGADDSPTEIVDGFLQAAAAGLTDDFTTAREFLTARARASWEPLGKVEVYGGQAAVGEVSEAGAVRVSADLTATVDGGGRYAEAVPGARTSVELVLAQNADGEWRIADLADGVLLSEPIFRSLFQQTALYFASPDAEALVSETRWYPRRAVETAAVGGLLAGPSPWLADAVLSAFPPGTRLVVDTVTVSDGTAQVDLSGEALEASPAQRSLMLAQLTETLVGVPRVQSVAVTVAGVPFEAPAPPGDLVVDPSVGSSPVVLADDALRAVEGGALVPLGSVADPLDIPAPGRPALPYDDGDPVVLSEGSDLVTAPADGAPPVSVLTTGADLTAPSFDRLGWVWTSPEDSDGVVHAVLPGVARAEVDADWLGGREIRSLRVSRDGARVLVVSFADGAALVEVAALVRDAGGRPLALGGALRIGQQITQASAAVWVDQQTVAVLGRVGTGSATTVALVPVGGPTSALPAVDGAVALAGGKGDRLLYVATADGELYARNGLGWTVVVVGVRDPAFPG